MKNVIGLETLSGLNTLSQYMSAEAGAGVAWQDFQDTWKTRIFPLGLGQEVFVADPYGALQALQIAKRMINSPIIILLNSQAAIAILRNLQAGLAQALAIQHMGVEGTERADQASEQAASRPGSGLMSLSQLKRGHAALGNYLHQVQARVGPVCHNCGEPRETGRHAIFECRLWRTEP